MTPAAGTQHQPPQAEPYKITSSKQMTTEFSKTLEMFKEKESESNWDQREKQIQKIRGMIKSGAHLEYELEFIENIKLFSEFLCLAMQSLRSALVSATCYLVQDLFLNLGEEGKMDFLSFTFVVSIIKLVSQSKKIVVQLGSNTMNTLLQNSSFNFKIFEKFVDLLCNDKSALVREKMSEFIYLQLTRHQNIDLYHIQELLEKAISHAIRDSTPLTRENGRNLFKYYSDRLQGKVDGFLNSLDITTKKTLMKSLSSNTSSLRNSAKSSIKASIAATIKASKPLNQEAGVEIFTVPPENIRNTTETNPTETKFKTPSKNQADSHSLNVSNVASPLLPPSNNRNLSTNKTSRLSRIPSVYSPKHTSTPKVFSKLSQDTSMVNYGDDNNSFLNVNESPSFVKNVNISFIKSSQEGSDTSFNHSIVNLNESDEKKDLLINTPKLQNSGLITATPMKVAVEESVVAVNVLDEVEFNLKDHKAVQIPRNINIETPVLKTKKGKVSQTSSAYSVINSPVVVSEGKNGRIKLNEFITKLENRNGLNDNYFKKLYRYSRNYAQTSMSELKKPLSTDLDYYTQLAIAYEELFDRIIKGMLDLLKSDCVHQWKENCLIILKHCIEFHPHLYDDYCEDLIDALLKIMAGVEPRFSDEPAPELLGISRLAEECLHNCLKFFERSKLTGIVISKICDRDEDSSDVSVIFRILGVLSLIRYSSQVDDKSFENEIILPLFKNGIVQKFLHSHHVIQRKSVYDFLVSCWKVLGNKFIYTYLEPREIDNSKQSNHFEGLSAPNFKLFQLLILKEK